MIRIADNLQMEASAAAGKSGSGKTNSLQLFAEAWMENGWPLVVVNPMGEFRALKALYPILVAGMQDDDDLSITPQNGAQIADFCFRERLSIVLDMSMHPGGQDIETLVSFLKAFWQRVLAQKKQNAAPGQHPEGFLDGIGQGAKTSCKARRVGGEAAR